MTWVSWQLRRWPSGQCFPPAGTAPSYGTNAVRVHCLPACLQWCPVHGETLWLMQNAGGVATGPAARAASKRAPPFSSPSQRQPESMGWALSCASRWQSATLGCDLHMAALGGGGVRVLRCRGACGTSSSSAATCLGDGGRGVDCTGQLVNAILVAIFRSYHIRTLYDTYIR